MDKKRISFFFQPYQIELNQHTIEKADTEGGLKRRYLKGIASGTAIDGQGERITKSCILSFQDQANTGDILLYPDRHNVNYTGDIGILVKSEVTPTGDWYAEFRLYDQSDQMGPACMETVDKLWRQMNGLPPYKTPKQKGFSIEGFIPEGGIIAMSEDGKRVVDKIVLDGCVVVPRPAYKTSIAHAVYKALDETPPWQIEKAIDSAFKGLIATEEVQNNYYKTRYTYQDKLEGEIDRIMGDGAIADKGPALDMLFKGYSSMMIDLVQKSRDMFTIAKSDGANSDTEDTSRVVNKGISDQNMVIKSLISNIDMMITKLT